MCSSNKNYKYSNYLHSIITYVFMKFLKVYLDI